MIARLCQDIYPLNPGNWNYNKKLWGSTFRRFSLVRLRARVDHPCQDHPRPLDLKPVWLFRTLAGAPLLAHDGLFLTSYSVPTSSWLAVWPWVALRGYCVSMQACVFTVIVKMSSVTCAVQNALLQNWFATSIYVRGVGSVGACVLGNLRCCSLESVFLLWRCSCLSFRTGCTLNHEGADGRVLCLHRLSCRDTSINARVFHTSKSASLLHLGLVSGCCLGLLDSSIFWQAFAKF